MISKTPKTEQQGNITQTNDILKYCRRNCETIRHQELLLFITNYSTIPKAMKSINFSEKKLTSKRLQGTRNDRGRSLRVSSLLYQNLTQIYLRKDKKRACR